MRKEKIQIKASSKKWKIMGSKTMSKKADQRSKLLKEKISLINILRKTKCKLLEAIAISIIK